jgi:predicted metal-dependent hydrolase
MQVKSARAWVILCRVQLGLPFPDSRSGPAEVGHHLANETPPAEAARGVPRDTAPSETNRRGHSATPDFYFVRHKRARRYLLRVDHDGRVRVTIPRGGSRREAEAFAVRSLKWIAAQRAKVPPPVLAPEDRRALKERARAELPPRLLALAAAHGLVVPRVSIRNQRSRWGSCGRDGHICLNWRLIAMPEAVRDYVLIHELMHLRRLDHSPAYWRLVAAACPGYREARAWLRANGATLR